MLVVYHEQGLAVVLVVCRTLGGEQTTGKTLDRALGGRAGRAGGGAFLKVEDRRRVRRVPEFALEITGAESATEIVHPRREIALEIHEGMFSVL